MGDIVVSAQLVFYGRNVWSITEPDAYKCANMAIDATEEFFSECGIPMTLTELGIDDSRFALRAFYLSDHMVT